MSRHVLIGVGGSGQHVVLAYLRMMALTVPVPAALPHVFILDADAEIGRGVGKRSRVVDDIAALLESMLRGEDPGQRPIFEVFKPFRAGTMTVKQLVGNSDAAQRLGQAFLADDDGEWGNDWEVELQRGMMANPKIGALALTNKVEGDMDADMRRLFACLGGSVRVAVVGSSFGGTGSGAVPALMRVLDNQQVAHVRAFMTLPWFAIEQPAEDTNERSAAASRGGIDPQERNATLGLHTYWSTLTGQSGLTRSSYVLSQSMEGWPRAKRRDQGNFDQEEHTHVLNLAQAGAIQAYFGVGQGTQEGMLFALRSTSPQESTGQFNATTSPHLRLRVGPNDARQLYDIAADAEATAMVLERGGRVLTSTSKGRMKLAVVHDKLELRDGQLAFVEALRRALGAKTVGIWWWRRLLTSLPSEVPEDSVFRGLGNALIQRAAEIRQSLLWLDAFVGEHGATAGITHLPGGHLFRAMDPTDFRKGVEPVLDQNALAAVWSGLGLQVTSTSGKPMPNAEVEAQAFTAFTRLFPSGTTDNGLVKQLQDALADKKTSKYDLAASVLTVAAHRSVMELRRGRLDTSGSAGTNVSPMLRLRVVGSDVKDDECLAAINLEKELVGANPLDPFQTEHPRSLKYLDPYTEFATVRDDDFSFDGATLPEHGLRGIPSLVAPILLQRWRANLCQPRAEDRDGQLRYADGQGGWRATKLGIYVHAARINEAALWLLASADPRVSFVSNLMADYDQQEPFLALAGRSLAGVGLSKLPALVLAPQPGGPGVQTPAFLWAGDTWCLAANQKARLFFAKLLRDLPSVRHAYRPNAPLLRRQGDAAGAVVDGLHRFFVTELRRLREQFATSATPEAVAVFCQLLDRTLADLPQPAAPEGHVLNTGGGGRSAAVFWPRRRSADSRACAGGSQGLQ